MGTLGRSPFRIQPHWIFPINTAAFKAAETPQTVGGAFKQEAIILLRKHCLLSHGSHLPMQPSAHVGVLLPQEGSSGPQDVPYLSVSPCGTHTLRTLHKHTQRLTGGIYLDTLFGRSLYRNKLLCRWLCSILGSYNCAAPCLAFLGTFTGNHLLVPLDHCSHCSGAIKHKSGLSQRRPGPIIQPYQQLLESCLFCLFKYWWICSFQTVICPFEGLCVLQFVPVSVYLQKQDMRSSQH